MKLISRFLAAAIFAMMALPLTASASSIQVTFTGTINSSNMTAFALGQSVTATFVYDSSATAAMIASQQAFYTNHFSYVSFSSGSYNAVDNTGPFGRTVKWDNLSVWDGISFLVAQNPGHYTFLPLNTVSFPNVFSGISQTFEGLRVTLEGPSTIWSDYSVPTSYNLSNFTNRNMMGLFSHGSWFAGIDQVQVTTVPSEVPEPTSLSLLALSGAVGLFMRRSRAH